MHYRFLAVDSPERSNDLSHTACFRPENSSDMLATLTGNVEADTPYPSAGKHCACRSSTQLRGLTLDR